MFYKPIAKAPKKMLAGFEPRPAVARRGDVFKSPFSASLSPFGRGFKKMKARRYSKIKYA